MSVLNLFFWLTEPSMMNVLVICDILLFPFVVSGLFTSVIGTQSNFDLVVVFLKFVESLWPIQNSLLVTRWLFFEFGEVNIIVVQVVLMIPMSVSSSSAILLKDEHIELHEHFHLLVSSI